MIRDHGANSHPMRHFFSLIHKDSSIEYVKEYKIDNEYVKVAVRAASSDRLYARTLYVLNRSRAEHFIETGKLIPVSD